MPAAPVREDVQAAAMRIRDEVARTPLIPARINGRDLWLKCENLQEGGAFKLRGASNRLLQVREDERGRGVVAFSSGNHARGVAIAARRLAMPAVIVMPSDAPQVKIDGTRGEGAEIRFYDRHRENREAIASDLAARSGAVLVPSFDDPHVIAGQGTAGLEILDQLAEAGHGAPPMIVTPCGGGGLAAGLALACPDSTIVAVEPDGWDDMARSLEAGRIIPVGADAPSTICDAIQTPHVSSMTLQILLDHGACARSVSDDEVRAAMRFAYAELGHTVEPGGAAALAAVLAGKVDPPDGSVIMLSGGNVDPQLMADVVAA